jgi:hypothetical protein
LRRWLAFPPRTAIPIHYEGWKHFRQGRAEVESACREAGIEERVRWLEPATPQTLEV